jgi:hypothetical protein
MPDYCSSYCPGAFHRHFLGCPLNQAPTGILKGPLEESLCSMYAQRRGPMWTQHRHCSLVPPSKVHVCWGVGERESKGWT